MSMWMWVLGLAVRADYLISDNSDHRVQLCDHAICITVAGPGTSGSGDVQLNAPLEGSPRFQLATSEDNSSPTQATRTTATVRVTAVDTTQTATQLDFCRERHDQDTFFDVGRRGDQCSAAWQCG